MDRNMKMKMFKTRLAGDLNLYAAEQGLKKHELGAAIGYSGAAVGQAIKHPDTRMTREIIKAISEKLGGDFANCYSEFMAIETGSLAREPAGKYTVKEKAKIRQSIRDLKKAIEIMEKCLAE